MRHSPLPLNLKALNKWPVYCLPKAVQNKNSRSKLQNRAKLLDQILYKQHAYWLKNCKIVPNMNFGITIFLSFVYISLGILGASHGLALRTSLSPWEALVAETTKMDKIDLLLHLFSETLQCIIFFRTSWRWLERRFRDLTLYWLTPPLWAKFWNAVNSQ